MQGFPKIGVGFDLDREDAATVLLQLKPPVDYYQVACNSARACSSKAANQQPGDCLASDSQALDLFKATRDEATSVASDVLGAKGGNLDDLCCSVRNVLVDLAFSLGRSKLASFASMLLAIAAEDWGAAASAMRVSEWYGAAPSDRALIHAETLRLGCTPSEGWAVAPKATSIFSAGGLAKSYEEAAGDWSAMMGGGAGSSAKGAGVHIRSAAVRGMPAFNAALQHAAKIASAVGTSTSVTMRAYASAEASKSGSDAGCEAVVRAWLSDKDAAAIDEAAFSLAVTGAQAAMINAGSRLTSFCCGVQKAVIDFVHSSGYRSASSYRRFFAAVAVSDFALASTNLNGGWCKANQARCAADQALLQGGCGKDVGYFALEDGYSFDKKADHSVAQRMIPAKDVPIDPAWPKWKKPGDAGWTPGSLIYECLNASASEVYPEYSTVCDGASGNACDGTGDGTLWSIGQFGPGRAAVKTGNLLPKWWSVRGTQPGATALGDFVSEHFAYILCVSQRTRILLPARC